MGQSGGWGSRVDGAVGWMDGAVGWMDGAVGRMDGVVGWMDGAVGWIDLPSSDVIETIPNATSLDALKKKTAGYTTLTNFFLRKYGHRHSAAFKSEDQCQPCKSHSCSMSAEQ